MYKKILRQKHKAQHTAVYIYALHTPADRQEHRHTIMRTAANKLTSTQAAQSMRNTTTANTFAHKFHGASLGLRLAGCFR